ncbi:hypothetical protein [Sphingomonas sp. Leaf34]|uniref:hypothetical protein n=1 Tax=Sphingomonas sp. Leaf34 TaxID=1736216 RepID=UPI0012E1E0AD|nr:hypothetical protein [Sphingomonas sp. Leaf34]
MKFREVEQPAFGLVGIAVGDEGKALVYDKAEVRLADVDLYALVIYPTQGDIFVSSAIECDVSQGVNHTSIY